MIPSPARGAFFGLWSAACASSAPPSEPTAAPSSGNAGELKVHLEIRAHAGKDAKCEPGDVCGFFLQVMSPGSDAKPLAEKAEKILRGKCAGDIIVYQDKRGVMGSGTVLASAEAKRACEQALGRTEPDPDFPSYGVFRIKS